MRNRCAASNRTARFKPYRPLQTVPPASNRTEPEFVAVLREHDHGTVSNVVAGAGGVSHALVADEPQEGTRSV
jgi:hypothetical protein